MKRALSVILVLASATYNDELRFRYHHHNSDGFLA